MSYISDESLEGVLYIPLYGQKTKRHKPLIKSRFLAVQFMLALTVLVFICPAAFSASSFFPYQITWMYSDDDHGIYFDLTASVELTSYDGDCANSFLDVDFSYTENIPEQELSLKRKRESRNNHYDSVIHSLLTSAEVAGNSCGCIGGHQGRNKYTSLTTNSNQAYGPKQLLLILHRLLTGQTKETYFPHIVIAELPHGLISGIDYDKNDFALSHVSVNTRETGFVINDSVYLISANLQRPSLYRDTTEWEVEVSRNLADHSYTISINTIELTNGVVKMDAQAPAWFGVEGVSEFEKLSMPLEPIQRSGETLSPVQQPGRASSPVQQPGRASSPVQRLNERPRLFNNLDERPRLFNDLNERPRLFNNLNERPRLFNDLNERPRLFNNLNERPRLFNNLPVQRASVLACSTT